MWVCSWLIVGVHEPKYSSTLPSSEFATGAHLSSEIENELGRALLPDSPRTGYLGYQMITAMEPLFYQYGVDLVSYCCIALLVKLFMKQGRLKLPDSPRTSYLG